eukprot:TRINITY_DN9217_c0_g1::TRINITY_DN9217_c0_g1_i1::g.13281::m.13281 TRINITY_DN9217_c0_g1::TRINITY_DN9217_c0_g1_i1::g.13281  ORF type:complete len:135 (+),score=38.42,sp/Q9SL42/PIN1_ARATH/64.35/1e-47,Rotamase/PF00639.16/6.7e-27,Rotamase_3/PF13616.1/1.2e-21,Rotamase_2/PF13145.1/3.4e-07 TRINITY_DN9217_c0_g1_i1:52-405(+)
MPDHVRASHILIKHSGSRNLSSWKDPSGARIKATSKDEAIKKLQAIREKIVAGQARFEEVARVESDCSSAQRGGDLGDFGRGEMQKPFEDAAFALNVNEISGIVDSGSGVHIVLRTA